MDQTQIREIIQQRAENFKVEHFEMTDALAAEVMKLHEDLVQIDPHYGWVSLRSSKSDQHLMTTSYTPYTSTKDQDIKNRFEKRLWDFQALVERMQVEGLA